MSPLAAPQLPPIILRRYCHYTDLKKAVLLEHILGKMMPGLGAELGRRFNEGQLRHWIRLIFARLFPPRTVMAQIADSLGVHRAALTIARKRGEITFPLFFQLLRVLNIQFKDLPNRPADIVSVVAGLAEAIPRVLTRLHLRGAPGVPVADRSEDTLSIGDSALVYSLMFDAGRQTQWITIVAACGGDLSAAMGRPAFQSLLKEVLAAAARLIATDDQASTELLKWTVPDPTEQAFAIHLVHLWNDYYMPSEIVREAAYSLLLLYPDH
jgi:hypothetical protein